MVAASVVAASAGSSFSAVSDDGDGATASSTSTLSRSSIGSGKAGSVRGSIEPMKMKSTGEQMPSRVRCVTPASRSLTRS